MLSLTEFQKNVKEYIIGQEASVNIVTTTIYKYLLKLSVRDFGFYFEGSTSLLLVGGSGCGKTYITKKAAQICKLPFIELNAKSISQEGWSGKSFVSLVGDAIHDIEYTSGRKCHGGIIFIDEFDKLLLPNFCSGGDDVNMHLQATLLKYIEGMRLDLKSRSIDTNEWLFIFAGAFIGLDIKPDQLIGFHNKGKDIKPVNAALIKFGMLPEIAGRIQEVAMLRELSATDYKKVLNSPHGALAKWTGALEKLDIKFKVSHTKLIRAAIESNLGMRGLIQAVERAVTQTINKNLHEFDLEKLSPLYTRRRCPTLEVPSTGIPVPKDPPPTTFTPFDGVDYDLPPED